MSISMPKRAVAVALLLASLAGAQTNVWQWQRRDLLPALDSMFGVLARDEFRGTNVLLCGREQDASLRWTSTATWEWADARWCLRSTVTAPTLSSALAFDPVRNSLLLFGSTPAAPFATQTWHYDGTAWTQTISAVRPSWRQAHGMATDPLRGRVVLFGGTASPTGSGSLLNDTWEWDGQNWSQRLPPVSPAARSRPLMAFDSATGRVAMFGGDSAQGGQISLGTVHEWDGAAWVTIASSAPLMVGTAATTDPTGGVLASAWSPLSSGLWRWDGASWSPLTNSFELNSIVAEGPDRVFAFGAQFTRNTYAYIRSQARGELLQDGFYPIGTERAAIACIEPTDELFLVCEPGLRTEFWLLSENGSFQSATGVPNIQLGITQCAFHPPSGTVVAIDDLGFSWSLLRGNIPLASLPLGSSPRLAGFFAPSGHVLAVARTAQNLEIHGYDGTAWSPRANGPALGSAPLGAVDGGRGRLVFADRNLTAAGEWDGTTFTVIPPPPAAAISALLPHPDGGVAAFEASALHRWDGTSWSTEPIANPMTTPTGPRVPSAFDSKRRRWVAFERGVVLDLEPVALSVDDATPQPGQTIAFTYARPASASLPWLLLLAAAEAPGIPWRPSPHGGTEVIPLANDWLFGGSLALGLGGMLDAQGNGTAPLPVPNLPLAGFRCFACAVTIGPPWPIEFVSPTVELTIRR